MKILTVGINHRTAPLEVRGRLAITELREALAKLHSYTEQGVILSTCNRTEVYTAGKTGPQEIGRFLSDYGLVPLEELSPYLYSYEQEEVARHLFLVASGLDSMILGEAQILGQVGEALRVAQAQGTVGPELFHLFREALRVGKRARADTAIGRNALSMSSAAVELARRTMGDLSSRRILVIGAGEAGKLTARALIDCGSSQVVVASRTIARARDLAQRLGGKALPFSSLRKAVEEADIVITSTAAPHLVLRREGVARVMARRPQRPLLLIDIAVPRDIDPAAKEVEGVLLYDIDDLEAVAQANLRKRKKEVAKVEGIVRSEVEKFRHWQRSREAVPTITALLARAEALRRAELEEALSKLPDLSERERSILEALTSALVRKMLHRPIVRLKEQSNHDYIQKVREIFGLDEGP